ncbi:MAG: hypothetical protein IH851_04165 [Armatimonadetes bacterium]|nr:hypothetical protein [Armatimonadota bacterium]
MNRLYFGNNLKVLRQDIEDEVADLIYLDPPFNSQRNYNLLFKRQEGQAPAAQIMAFEDTWQWSDLAYEEFKIEERNASLFGLVDSLYQVLGKCEMMAYIVMMAPRLLELHRKLKKAGSLYLHCDPVASHYLKVILDSIFGADRFINEIVWKRSSAHNDTKQGMKRCGRIHDVLLFYVKGKPHKWNPQYMDYDEDYLEQEYRHTTDEGRHYKETDPTAAKPGGDTEFLWRVKRRIDCDERWQPDLQDEYLNPKGEWEYRAVPPYKGRYWAYKKENLIKFWRSGTLIHRKTGMPRIMQFADEQPGISLQDIWHDITPVTGKERRGYPTQKPLALLERIIAASTDEGDLVLDPFAGCGTAIVAAERMNRKWIGIDVTYLAINEIINRLQEEKREGVALEYELHGTPIDAQDAQVLFETTRDQNHKPYEQWAVSSVGGRWNEKGGADAGIDGRLGLWHPTTGRYLEAVIQVKGGNALTLSAVRDFGRVIEREKAPMGFMISQKEPTKKMIQEAESLGYADWPSKKKYPRYQVRSVKQLLEDREPFEIPDSYRPPPEGGVGRKKDARQYNLGVES